LRLGSVLSFCFCVDFGTVNWENKKTFLGSKPISVLTFMCLEHGINYRVIRKAEALFMCSNCCLVSLGTRGGTHSYTTVSKLWYNSLNCKLPTRKKNYMLRSLLDTGTSEEWHTV
jgi:hypothetical protein